jgi:hypothetical protein
VLADDQVVVILGLIELPLRLKQKRAMRAVELPRAGEPVPFLIAAFTSSTVMFRTAIADGSALIRTADCDRTPAPDSRPAKC